MHHLCREIGLPPLRKEDVCQYLSGGVSDALAKTAGLASLIYRYTEGNPLFMVTVLEHLRDRKLVALQGSVWTLNVPVERVELRTPESLRQMIEVQIGRLSDEERRVLEAGSVTGSVFSTVVGAACADMDPIRFEELCEELARKEQVVRPTEPVHLPDGTMSERYAFVHSMYGEVLYTRQGASRRAKLHLRASARIAALYAQCIEEAAGDLAHHCERGGDWEGAIKYLQVAADSSARRFGPRQAAAILEHALDLVSRVPATQRAELEVSILERSAVICNASLGSRKIDGATHAVRSGNGCPLD
jgi:predicted ATPase